MTSVTLRLQPMTKMQRSTKQSVTQAIGGGEQGRHLITPTRVYKRDVFADGNRAENLAHAGASSCEKRSDLAQASMAGPSLTFVQATRTQKGSIERR